MLILASQSKSRGRLLSAAGVEFETIPADIDEDAVKSAEPDGFKASRRLAVEKAMKVSALRPEAHVIGADQIMELEGRSFSKPADKAEAREHLKQMRGKTHHLINGAAVVRGGEVLWSVNTAVHVTMRDFSDSFLESYLEKAGPEVCRSVGAYYLEELGSQLIDKIEGDYFSVLGLPMLPLFDFLRSCGEMKQ